MHDWRASRRMAVGAEHNDATGTVEDFCDRSDRTILLRFRNTQMIIIIIQQNVPEKSPTNRKPHIVITLDPVETIIFRIFNFRTITFNFQI